MMEDDFRIDWEPNRAFNRTWRQRDHEARLFIGRAIEPGETLYPLLEGRIRVSYLGRELFDSPQRLLAVEVELERRAADPRLRRRRFSPALRLGLATSLDDLAYRLVTTTFCLGFGIDPTYRSWRYGVPESGGYAGFSLERVDDSIVLVGSPYRDEPPFVGPPPPLIVPATAYLAGVRDYALRLAHEIEVTDPGLFVFDYIAKWPTVLATPTTTRLPRASHFEIAIDARRLDSVVALIEQSPFQRFRLERPGDLSAIRGARLERIDENLVRLYPFLPETLGSVAEGDRLVILRDQRRVAGGAAVTRVALDLDASAFQRARREAFAIELANRSGYQRFLQWNDAKMASDPSSDRWNESERARRWLAFLDGLDGNRKRCSLRLAKQVKAVRDLRAC